MGFVARPWTRLFLLSAIAFAVVAGWGIAKYTSEAAPDQVALPLKIAQTPGKRMVHLYFGDGNGRYLVAEQRIMDQPADDVAFGRRLVEALIQGPQKGGSRTLPPDALLNAIYVTSGGTAFLDFGLDSFADHPGGVSAELLSIYSIVNTLVMNVDSIRSVKFLIGGREAATLAGHVDLQDLFEADMLWVR